MFRLNKLFGNSGSGANGSDSGVAILAEEDGATVALLASELLGKQQFVIKSLGEGMRNTPGISGSAIMPDGNVGLILNVGDLVKMASGSTNSSGEGDADTGRSDS
jgi:two-component system chemotaxis sensor kinase CheA